MVLSILPKVEQISISWEDAQDSEFSSFFERIEDTILSRFSDLYLSRTNSIQVGLKSLTTWVDFRGKWVCLLWMTYVVRLSWFYSSNRDKMSTWKSFVKIGTVSNCEFNANFLTFFGLYHFPFALEVIRFVS